MVRDRSKQPILKQARFQGKSGQPIAISVGPLLLDLQSALQRAERCRLALVSLGYSREHWQEIVRDVNPELRFVLSPRLLDKTITYLESVGRPLSRKSLTRALHLQGAGTLQRIRQSLTSNLRSGNLAHFPGYKVGLPAWKKKE
ncbi:MAG TPA: hypothetical protein VFP11_12220 [Candidatus Angelobacter sp.]|nr:hypothetical protein [Candidatus Angelobacter sp.]